MILDLDAPDDGHLSGVVNFYGNVRPDGFTVGNKFPIITDDPRAGIVQQFLHLTIRFIDVRTAPVQVYIDGSGAQFQNVNTVATVQAELDERYAKMWIEAAKKSTSEDDKSHPKVGADAVKHGQLLGVDCRTAEETSGKKNGNTQNFALLRLGGMPSMGRPSTRHWSLALIAATQRCLAWID